MLKKSIKFKTKVSREYTNKRGLYVLLLVLFSAGFCHAQPKGGDFMLGGSIAFDRQRGSLPDDPSAGTTTLNYLNFAPKIGVFVSPRWQVGFATRIRYEGMANNSILSDSLGNKYNFDFQSYTLRFSFGIHASFYCPLGKGLYWVSTIEPHWGTVTDGDKLSSLFSENKPQQDRRRFLTVDFSTGLQYFMRPNLSVSFGINPVNYTFEYQKTVLNNQPISKRNSNAVTFTNAAKGLFIGVNYLIISDNE